MGVNATAGRRPERESADDGRYGMKLSDVKVSIGLPYFGRIEGTWNRTRAAKLERGRTAG